MVRTGFHPTLARAVARGEYVVDPQAVAAAMLSRRRPREGSGVLVAAQLFDGPSARVDKGRAVAGGDLP